MTDEELLEAQQTLEKMNQADQAAQVQLAECKAKRDAHTLALQKLAVEFEEIRQTRLQLKDQYGALYERVGVELRKREQAANEEAARAAETEN